METQRNRDDIERELVELGVRISGLCAALHDGTPAYAQPDLPDELSAAAGKLAGLANELGQHWPASRAPA